MTEIYTPAEDSYFFSEFLKENIKDKNISFLDMGCGSGILCKTAKEDIGISNILGVDSNSDAVNQTKKEIQCKVLHSDLFEKIEENEKFDIICFNAPYLPEDNREPKESKIATTGGKNGDEISLRFLKQALHHLNKNGKIFLLISNLTPLDNINKFNPKIVATKNIFTEKLLILEFKKQ